jgi:phosphatidylcholine synthase
MMIRGLCVHLFTASGTAFAFLALAAAIERDFPAMFAWLGVAFAVDAIDGFFARRSRVNETVPFIDGALLDLVVDYLTYVLVPVVALWRGEALPPTLQLPLALAICAGSALYFADRRMKAPDNWFRGFPALWNVVALYIFAFQPPPVLSAITIALLVPAMFAPFVFVHPMRVRRLRSLTIAVTALWGLSAMVAIGEGLEADQFSRAGLAVSAIYILSLPLLRHSPWAEPGKSDD